MQSMHQGHVTVKQQLTAPDAAGDGVEVPQRIHVRLALTVVLCQRVCQVLLSVLLQHLQGPMSFHLLSKVDAVWSNSVQLRLVQKT